MASAMVVGVPIERLYLPYQWVKAWSPARLGTFMAICASVPHVSRRAVTMDS